jgi:hypothetical protein
MIKHVISLLLLIGLSYSQGGDKSFSFSSSGSKYGRIPIDNSLYGFTTFTLECWYYESGFSGGDERIVGIEAANQTGGISLSRYSTSSWSYGAGDTDGNSLGNGNTGTVTQNQWTHVAISYDDTTIRLFINGVLIHSEVGTLNSIGNSSYDFTINRHTWNGGSSSRITGEIDELRISNIARYTSNFSPPFYEFSSDANTAGLWHFNDNFNDASSNSNNGTAVNGAGYVTSNAPIGDLGSSYKTDVEAIWKVSGTSASDASDGLTMTVSSALSTGNFAVYGNNNTNGTSTSDIGSVGSTNRTGRIWQVDESGTVAGTIIIDISDATGNAGQSGTASNFRLLYRSGTSGDFSSAATGASISGDVVTFTSVSLADGYYALGSESDASLPVELTSFEVLSARDNSISLQWITESEINNLGFILDRRTPTDDWMEIASFVTDTELQGQGSVSHQTVYTYTDDTVMDNEVYDYRIADVDYDGNKEYHSLQLMGISPASIPSTYVLHQNYPNPFNPITTLSYDLPEDALVNITIYDMMGRIVNNLVSSRQAAGYKSVLWNATNNLGEPVSAGLYLYTIQAGQFRQIKKMVLLK